MTTDPEPGTFLAECIAGHYHCRHTQRLNNTTVHILDRDDAPFADNIMVFSLADLAAQLGASHAR